MTASVIQPSFAAGEMSPGFWGHTDHIKFRIGASTMRNMFVSIRGGAYSRAGTAFAGKAKQPASAGSTPPRIMPFQFKVGQGYILEFGDFYVRFISNGAYVTEAPFAIATASQANPLTLNVPGHDFANGDWVFTAGALGMTELDNATFIVANVAGNNFALTDLFGNPINSINFPAYTAGGTIARIYTVTTPYLASDLPYLKPAQSADLMSLCLSNPLSVNEYAPQDLDRLAANNWTLLPTVFASSIAAPAACTAAASAAPSGTLASAQYAYCVTAIDATTGEESVASPIAYVSSVDIAITAGSITVTWDPVPNASGYNVFKAPAAVYVNGATAQKVPIGSQFGFVGSSVGNQFVDQNVIQDFTTTPPLHDDPFAPGQILGVTPGAGGAGYTQTTVSATITTATGDSAVIIPVVVAGAVTAYIVPNGGEKYQAGDTLVVADSGGGAGATGTLIVGPQSGTYPGVVTYFQQRRGYADSFNNPDTYFFTQTGAFTNLDQADPPIDSDAITGSPWAQQVNGIQWMVPMPGGLIVCTGLDCWALAGSAGPATQLTPASQNATAQESYGFSPTLPPIRIGAHFLYVDALDAVVRDNVYNFFSNTYTGDDLTQLSNHLFDGHKIVQWAWARTPFKIVWAVRDDGVLLSLTYLKEQEVIAWARHDTNGQVISVAVASEPPVDAVYLVVKRFISGKNAYGYFVERMDNRLWPNAESCWCVDAGLSLPLTMPNATLTAGAAAAIATPLAQNVPFTASAAVFDGVTTGVAGQIIRIGGGKAQVSAFVSPTQVNANILIAITATVPDIPANLPQMPRPAASGTWSIATPVTTISGLNHLEGMTVTGLADGAVIPPTVVTDGAITLASPASAVTVGLPFQAQLQSLHLQKEGEMIQDQRKKVIGVTVRIEKSRGVKLGANQPNASAQENGTDVPWGNYPWGKMVLIPEQQNQLGPNQYLPLFTGDHYIPIDDDWNTPGQSASPGMIAAQQDFPLPMQVLAFIPKFDTGDSKVP
jgi:hypothetical protein